ncbi:MAG: hypothetical protein A2V93_02940 [Ignavibacteria bacterium RBG_16_34_14]|nr:MAG: hypothetical protein A2V93_02940 [Ignavibacteria bacterium RBG_16_34_14]
MINNSSFSQSSTDSLEFIYLVKPQNILSTSFDKLLNTYSLNSGLIFNKSFGDFSFNINENFNSKFVKTGQNNIRDEQKISLSTSYKLSKIIGIGISAENRILSDDRTIEINQASISNVSLFTLYSPQPDMTFSPFIGYSNNRQIGENDYGLIYGLEGTVNNLDISDFNLTSQLKFRNEDISPRKNLIRYLSLIADNSFDKDVANIFSARFIQNRKDFYFTAEPQITEDLDIVNNIQSRTETGYSVEDRLRFGNFIDIFTFDALGKVAWREIDRDTRYRPVNINSTSVFDTKINELRVEFEALISYYSDFFYGSLRGIFSERDEKNITKNFEGSNPFFFEERKRQESQKNNNSIRASFTFLGGLNFSKTDKLVFSLLQNKLKYDTPGEENFDDRDEILSIFRLRYSKLLTPFFEAFIGTEGTYSHIVYLFSEKSSNNNINRVLKFASGGNYFGKNVSSSNTFEVSANYTVYDFEDLNPNYKSFSFRQFTAIDSSTIRILRNLSFNVYGYLKFSEQGDFKWTSFSERPTRFLEEIYGEPKFTVNINRINFSFGLRYFSLKTFNYDKREKIIDSDYLSKGPLMEIFILLKDILYLRIYGWYEFITINSAIKQKQTNFIMQMNWSF